MIFIAILKPRERAVLPDGREWRGPNALGDIARTLIGEGAAPDAKLLALRDGRPVLEGTLAAFGGRAWAGANSDPKFRKWCPHPHAQMPLLLVQWAAKNRFLRSGRHLPSAATPEGPDEPREAV